MLAPWLTSSNSHVGHADSEKNRVCMVKLPFKFCSQFTDFFTADNYVAASIVMKLNCTELEGEGSLILKALLVCSCSFNTLHCEIRL